jgi:hypothetical protein
MPTLENAVARFTALTATPEPEGQELWECAQEIVELGRHARPDERDAALSRLLVALEHGNAQIAGMAAMTGGSLVEQGASPKTLGSALLAQAPGVLSAALRFADRCISELGLDEEEEAEDEEDTSDEAEVDEDNVEDADDPVEESAKEDDEEENGISVAGHVIPDDAMARFFADDPQGVHAYIALDQWCYPTIACLTREPSLRADARQISGFAETADRLNQVSESGGAFFLSKLLIILDDEPLLVLHPETKKGFRCHMGGIADNFQLHTLLMDALIAPETNASSSGGLTGGLPGQRPNPVWATIARGDGPQEADHGVTGAWNLYNWTALDRNGRLPGSADDDADSGDAGFMGMAHWIWNEGTPADIMPFEGQRIVLLGPPAYQRSWNCARLFDALPAYVRVEELLTPQAVEAWLRRLATANPANAA